MPSTKISQLSQLASADNADQLVIVDVSDTSMAPTGTSKRIRAGDLIVYQAVVGVRLATNGALPANNYSANVLTALANGILTIDGIVPVAGDRILVKNEVAAANNGIYVVTSPGSATAPWVLTRTSEHSISTQFIPGEPVGVAQGTNNVGSIWIFTTVGAVTLGTTGLAYAQQAPGSGVYAGIENVFTKRNRIAITPEARVNYCNRPRPGIAPDLVNWQAGNGSFVQAAPPGGVDALGGSSNVVRITRTVAGGTIDWRGNDFGGARFAVVAGQQISASFWGYQGAANGQAWGARLSFRWWSSAQVLLSTSVGSTTSYPLGVWQKFTYTTTVPANAVWCDVFYQVQGSGIVGDISYVDALCAEISSTPGIYFDGSYPGSTWQGTAYASYSNVAGSDSFLQGRDVNNTATIWQFDKLGVLWVPGADIAGGRITRVGDANADDDALNRRTGDARYLVGGGAPVSSLPSYVRAVTGQQANIYFDNFLRTAGLPLNSLGLDVVCTKGYQDDKRWYFTPADADAGTVPWTLNIYSGNSLLATVGTNIVFVAKNAANGITRKLVTIGDSLTGPSLYGGGTWLAELQNLLIGDVMTVTQVGSQTTTATDANGNTRTIKTDGVSGKTIAYFYSDPASPFVYSGSFNFAQYLTTYGITLSANDWVFIHLGTNDFLNQTDDTTLNGDINIALSQLSTMITNIKAAVSGIRIAICQIIPPAASQDAFAGTFGSTRTRFRYKRNHDIWCEAIKANYDDVSVANVFPVAMNLVLDSEHNFPTYTSYWNSRVPNSYSRQNDAVHPNPYGYYQMADQVYSFLKAMA
jgi:lysophospholipase L1-like esterase